MDLRSRRSPGQVFGCHSRLFRLHRHPARQTEQDSFRQTASTMGVFAATTQAATWRYRLLFRLCGQFPLSRKRISVAC